MHAANSFTVSVYPPTSPESPSDASRDVVLLFNELSSYGIRTAKKNIFGEVKAYP